MKRQEDPAAALSRLRAALRVRGPACPDARLDHRALDLMDDDELAYSSPHHVVAGSNSYAASGWTRQGVDHVVPGGAERDSAAALFERDPAQYPAGAWDRYDLIAREARRSRCACTSR